MKSVNERGQLLIDFSRSESEPKSNILQECTTQILKLNTKKNVFKINHLKKKRKKDLLQHIIQHGKSF